MSEEKVKIIKKRLLSLKDGWADNKENKPYTLKFIDKIGRVLKFIDENNLPFPIVGPVDGNSIDLFWRNEKRSFLMNFDEEWGDLIFTGCLIERDEKNATNI